MRLLNTKTGQFVDVLNPRTHVYAILSHTWDREGEQTYQELQDIQRPYGPDGRRLSSAPSFPSSPTTSATTAKSRSSHKMYRTSQPTSIWHDSRLSPKIRRACETAYGDGFRYIWNDACCIDKTNSSELSEAINSMHAWYRDAKVCYAYLADVSPGPSLQEQFSESRWFTRGWTLQELIAPQEVVFLTKQWTSFGTKHSMAQTIERITGIGQDVLKHEVSLDRVSVAKRMSWASKRHTTRLEDEAYSLLGIFNIHMLPSYGEGRGAFRRLQEEIMKRIPDQSLFAWGNPTGIGPVPALLLPNASSRIPDAAPRGKAPAEEEEARPPLLSAVQPNYAETLSLFATSPRDFHSSGHVHPLVDYDDFSGLLGGIHVPVQDYSLSPNGVRTQFPLLDLSNTSIVHPEDQTWYIAILACTDGDLRLLGRLCVSPVFNTHTSKIHLLHSTTVQINDAGDHECGLFVLPYPWELENPAILQHIHTRTVHLPYRDREAPALDELELTLPYDPEDAKDLQVLYTEWARDTLRAQGYGVAVQSGTKHGHNDSGLLVTLSKAPHTIQISCQYSITTRPDRGLRFFANIYVRAPSPANPVGRLRGSLSSGSRTAPAHRESDTPHRVMTLFAAYGQRSCSDAVSLPRAGSGGEVVLRMGLEVVSAACYHLRIALDETLAARLRLDEETATSGELEGDEDRLVLRAGGIRLGSP